MTKLIVGIVLLVIFGVAFSASPQSPDTEFGPLLARAKRHIHSSFGSSHPSIGSSHPSIDGEIPQLAINICVFDRNQDNTFEFEHKAHNVLHNGRTFLVNHANPKEQHLFLQHKLHPHLKFEFQVHFSEAELQSSGRFCTTARTLQSDGRFIQAILMFLLPGLLGFG